MCLHQTHTRMWQYVDHLVGLQPRLGGRLDQTCFLTYLLKKATTVASCCFPTIFLLWRTPTCKPPPPLHFIHSFARTPLLTADRQSQIPAHSSPFLMYAGSSRLLSLQRRARQRYIRLRLVHLHPEKKPLRACSGII